MSQQNEFIYSFEKDLPPLPKIPVKMKQEQKQRRREVTVGAEEEKKKSATKDLATKDSATEKKFISPSANPIDLLNQCQVKYCFEQIYNQMAHGGTCRRHHEVAQTYKDVIETLETTETIRSMKYCTPPSRDPIRLIEYEDKDGKRCIVEKCKARVYISMLYGDVCQIHYDVERQQDRHPDQSLVSQRIREFIGDLKLTTLEERYVNKVWGAGEKNGLVPEFLMTKPTWKTDRRAVPTSAPQCDHQAHREDGHGNKEKSLSRNREQEKERGRVGALRKEEQQNSQSRTQRAEGRSDQQVSQERVSQKKRGLRSLFGN